MGLIPAEPALRNLLTAQLAADFADWLDIVAIMALLAFHWHAGPTAFAWFAAATALPYLIVGPVAGALVDRWPLKPVLILSNLGRATATLALILAPDWPTLMVLISLRAAIDTFFTPAKQAALQALTSPGNRAAMNGLSHAVNQTSKIAAPALGGLLLTLMPPQGVFVANAATSALAAALLLPLILPARPPAQTKPKLLADLLDGFREVRRNRALRGAFALMAAAYFAMFLYDTLIAPLVRDIGFTETTLGFGLAALGAGGVAGSLAPGRHSQTSHPFLWIAAGSATGGSLVAGLALAVILGHPPGLFLFLSLFALLGVASAISIVPTRVILQNETAPDRMARVVALSEALNTMAILTAPFIGAAIARQASVATSFLAGGLLLILSSLYALWLHRR